MKLTPLALARALHVIRTAPYSALTMASAAGVATDTMRGYIKAHPEYKAQVDIARGEYLAVLETEAHRRAVDGIEETRDGKVTTKYDTTLLVKLLEKQDPSGYGKRVGVTVDGTVKHLHAPIDVARLTDDQLEKLVGILNQIEGAAPAPEAPDASADLLDLEVDDVPEEAE